MYITGSFSSVGAELRRNIAAVQIGTGYVKSRNFSANWPDARSYNDLVFFQNSVIIAGGIDDGGSTAGRKHAAAISDTVAGNLIDYVFTSGGNFGTDIQHLYWAADVTAMALSGDTLFAFSKGTFNTRVSAVRLGSGYPVFWAKYFNSIATAVNLAVSNGALFLSGNGLLMFTKQTLPIMQR